MYPFEIPNKFSVVNTIKCNLEKSGSLFDHYCLLHNPGVLQICERVEGSMMYPRLSGNIMTFLINNQSGSIFLVSLH